MFPSDRKDMTKLNRDPGQMAKINEAIKRTRNSFNSENPGQDVIQEAIIEHPMGLPRH